MKAAALTIALLMSGAAFAQTDGTVIANDGDAVAIAAYEADPASDAITDQTVLASPGVQVVQPSNAAPERDARGIAVVSDPAVVPAGFNGTVVGAAMGGPELNPVTGEPVAAASYPACTKSVTDNCLQRYERGRKAH